MSRGRSASESGQTSTEMMLVLAIISLPLVMGIRLFWDSFLKEFISWLITSFTYE